MAAIASAIAQFFGPLFGPTVAQLFKKEENSDELKMLKEVVAVQSETIKDLEEITDKLSQRLDHIENKNPRTWGFWPWW